ncbi:hypothetical protein BDZ45DRAFT_804282 [Acephala macrosclerotiorum]|nr:hypothetical protein BDZ45DRAFT_804282 [Acephala macrosclerotiorum]
MASVYTGNEAEHQNVSKPMSVKNGRKFSPPNTHNDPQIRRRPTLIPLKTPNDPQPQLQPQPSDPEIQALDQQLLAAQEAIGLSRKKALDREGTIASLQQAYQQERTFRIEGSDVYNQLNNRHAKLITDLHSMSNQCRSLHQQLEEAKGTISNLESTAKELEEEKVAMAQQRESELALADNRIAAAEERTMDLVKLHESQLIEAWDSVGAAQEKINKLEKDREHMMWEHDSAISDAANRIAAAEQHISELQQCNNLERHELSDSPEYNPSPKTKRRLRPENEPGTGLEGQSGPATRGRKRRSMATVQEEDTIEVEV